MVINPNSAFRSRHKAVVCDYGQRMRWLDGVIDSMDMSLSKLQEVVQGRGFSRQEYWSGVPLPSPRGVLEEPN